MAFVYLDSSALVAIALGDPRGAQVQRQPADSSQRGRYDEALHQVQKTLELNPNFSSAHQTLGWIYLNEGEHDHPIHEFKSAVELAGATDNDFILDLGFAYATAGHRTEARKILNQVKKKCEQGLATSASVAILYGAPGESDQAFAWLGKAYTERDPELT